MSYRLGVDVGGTFTDVLLVDEDSGSTWRAKTASTPARPVGRRPHGIGQACAAAGIELRRDRRRCCTARRSRPTRSSRARAPRVGLVTTQGFRQVLQIARSYVPGGLAGWIIWPKPEPLAALENTVEVDERIASDGVGRSASSTRPTSAPSSRSWPAAASRRWRSRLINSFADPAHEKRIAEIAAEVLPGVPVSLSSDVLPEMREYERTLTTVANGYVQPQVKRYVADAVGPAAARAASPASWRSCAATAACSRPRRRGRRPGHHADVRPGRRRDRRGRGSPSSAATAT